MKTSHTAAAALLAGAVLLLAPVPASASTCPAGQHWNAMGGGSGFCSPDASGGGTGGSGSVNLGGTTAPAPQAPEFHAPPAYKAPVYAPAPVQAPAPVYQAPAPVYQAPANSYVRPKSGTGYQSSVPGAAPVPGAVPQYSPAVGADSRVPAEAVPVQPAPAPSSTPEQTAAVAATPTATATPSPTVSIPPAAATVSTEQTSSAEAFNPAPLLLTIGAVMLAASLARFLLPVRAPVTRVVARRRP